VQEFHNSTSTSDSPWTPFLHFSLFYQGATTNGCKAVNAQFQGCHSQKTVRMVPLELIDVGSLPTVISPSCPPSTLPLNSAFSTQISIYFCTKTPPPSSLVMCDHSLTLSNYLSVILLSEHKDPSTFMSSPAQTS
jgi:hypothetical protein